VASTPAVPEKKNSSSNCPFLCHILYFPVQIIHQQFILTGWKHLKENGLYDLFPGLIS
jgi:hypothetical protein